MFTVLDYIMWAPAYACFVRLMLLTGWLPRLPRLHPALPVHARQDGGQPARQPTQVRTQTSFRQSARHEPARLPSANQLHIPRGELLESIMMTSLSIRFISFLWRQGRRQQERQASELLQGKSSDEVRKQNLELYNKYQKYVCTDRQTNILVHVHVVHV